MNEAIDYYNRLQHSELLEKRLMMESDLIRNDSVSVLKDFEEIDHVV